MSVNSSKLDILASALTPNSIQNKQTMAGTDASNGGKSDPFKTVIAGNQHSADKNIDRGAKAKNSRAAKLQAAEKTRKNKEGHDAAVELKKSKTRAENTRSAKTRPTKTRSTKTRDNDDQQDQTDNQQQSGPKDVNDSSGQSTQPINHLTNHATNSDNRSWAAITVAEGGEQLPHSADKFSAIHENNQQLAYAANSGTRTGSKNLNTLTDGSVDSGTIKLSSTVLPAVNLLSENLNDGTIKLGFGERDPANNGAVLTGAFSALPASAITGDAAIIASGTQVTVNTELLAPIKLSAEGNNFNLAADTRESRTLIPGASGNLNASDQVGENSLLQHNFNHHGINHHGLNQFGFASSLLDPTTIDLSTTDKAMIGHDVENTALINTGSQPVESTWAQNFQTVHGLVDPLKSTGVQLQLPLNIHNPQWFAAMADRVSWLASQAIQVADIHLDPPELGPLQVRISVNQDQASVNFVSNHASVRDTLDSQLQRLRELFANEGMNLVDVNVSDRHQHAQDQHQRASGVDLSGGTDPDDSPVRLPITEIKNWVDYYV